MDLRLNSIKTRVRKKWDYVFNAISTQKSLWLTALLIIDMPLKLVCGQLSQLLGNFNSKETIHQFFFESVVKLCHTLTLLQLH